MKVKKVEIYLMENKNSDYSSITQILAACLTRFMAPRHFIRSFLGAPVFAFSWMPSIH